MCLSYGRKFDKIQSQYLSNWHDNFTNYIISMLSAIVAFETMSTVTEKDKKGLAKLKLVLLTTDDCETEKDLAASDVKKSVIDKIMEIYKRITEICFEHIRTSTVVR